MTDDYAPFPHAELDALASHHEAVAAAWKPITERGRQLITDHTAWAKACRDAIASYTALQTRCLEDETVKRLRFSGQLEAAD